MRDVCVGEMMKVGLNSSCNSNCVVCSQKYVLWKNLSIDVVEEKLKNSKESIKIKGK